MPRDNRTDERAEPESLRPESDRGDSPFPPPPPPRARPQARRETPASGSGIPTVFSLALDVERLETEQGFLETRVQRLEERTESTGQHDVAELRKKNRELERREEEREREVNEKADRDRRAKEAEEKGQREEAAHAATAEAKAKKDARDRKLELAFSALLGGVVAFGVQALRDCAAKPAPQPAAVVLPVQVAPAAPAAPTAAPSSSSR